MITKPIMQTFDELIIIINVYHFLIDTSGSAITEASSSGASLCSALHLSRLFWLCEPMAVLLWGLWLHVLYGFVDA
jgi:hypothetical protein